MVREQGLTPIVKVNNDLVSVLSLLTWSHHIVIVGPLSIIQRVKDPISVTWRTLLLRSVIDVTLFVIFEGRQESDALLVEAME